MKRLALMLLLLAALATPIVLFVRPNAQASPGATITVNSTADTHVRDDWITLREAMLLATGDLALTDLTYDECQQVSNSTYDPPCSTIDTIGAASADSIVFSTTVFPPATPATITLTTALPILDKGSDTVDGSLAGVIVVGSTAFTCFTITSDGNRIKGIDLIAYCSAGVHIEGGQDNTVGGATLGERNVISGNTYGILISPSGSNGNTVKGNYIGTNAAGTSAYPNDEGIEISAGCQNNGIGGTSAGERNIISGNSTFGIVISGGGANGNWVKGNYIGLNAAGTAALPNNGGLRIHNGAQNNTVGGSTAGERNVISGNSVGINILSAGSNGNIVIGNYIGTNAAGTAAIPNVYGVSITSQPRNNIIGGTTDGAGNLISGNTSDGIVILGAGTSGNLVRGNYIGSNAAGTAAISNGRGIGIQNGPQGNIVGGSTPSAGNVIAYNATDGVRIDGSSTTDNTITGNSVHSNVGKGIENINGGNTELAPPIIDSAGGGVSGHTNPKCYPCTVEVFSDSEDEGRIYHGSITTNDDATGTWIFVGSVSGPNITATITDASGNTSEFSVPVTYSPAVGGIAELPNVAQGNSSARNFIVLAGFVAVTLLALIAGAWYARRRWLER